MSVTLVLPDHLTVEISKAASHSLETAGVLIATLVTSPGGGIRLLGLDIKWVPADAYTVREHDRLSIASKLSV